MSLNQLSRLLQNSEGGPGGGPPQDAPQVDTAEQIYISSLALIKMLKHGTYLQECRCCRSCCCSTSEHPARYDRKA